MDTFVDSSWYFFRFATPGANTMIDARARYWMSVDQYIGGIEHAILHLLYARFWTKVMRDIGISSVDEPFTNLLTQGMVLNHIFQRRGEKGGITYFAPDEITIEHDADGRVVGARAKDDGKPVDYDGIGTMSKSKRNGVDPQELIEKYGADTARFFIIFTSPPEQTLEWSDAGVDGSFRFLRRVWSFAQDVSALVQAESSKRDGQFSAYRYPTDWPRTAPAMAAIRRELHTHLKQATYDIERHQFNTVASAAMKLLNALSSLPKVDAAHLARDPTHTQLLHEGMSILLRVLSPVTPHITHALWTALGFAGDLVDAPWPVVDPLALEQDEIELVVQVNGKLRGSMRIQKAATQGEIEASALKLEAVAKFTNGKPPRKVIVVPGRLVNIVV